MGRFGRHVYVLTRLPFAASSMEQLRPPTWAPTLRGQIHVRTLLQPRIICPDIEEVQGWVSAQRGSKRGGSPKQPGGFGWHPKGWFHRADAGLPWQSRQQRALQMPLPNRRPARLQSEGSCFAGTLGLLCPSACLPVYP